MSQPASSDTIWDVEVIAPTVVDLKLSAKARKHTSDDFVRLSSGLPLLFYQAMSNVLVFRIVARRRTADEKQRGLSCTAVAAPILADLKQRNPDATFDYSCLVGFRCRYCLNHPIYVPGCTAFAALVPTNGCASQVWSTINSRAKHFSECPWVSLQSKLFFANEFKNLPPTQAEKNFSVSWTICASYTYFPHTLPGDMATKLGLLGKGSRSPATTNDPKKKQPMLQLDSSREPQPDNYVLFDHLQNSLQVASKLVNQPVVVFDDLAEEMDYCMTPALFMELVSESFRLCVEYSHPNSRQKVIMRCSKCLLNGPELAIPSLLSPEPLPHYLASQLCQFVVSHGTTCPTRSEQSQQFFHEQAQSISLEFWQTFVQWWHVHLKKYFRSFEALSIVGQDAPTVDAGWLDMVHRSSMYKQNRDAELRAPVVSLQAPPCPAESGLPVLAVTSIVDDERYRDTEANRWYRNQISYRRSLFARSSAIEQEDIVRKILDVVEVNGYDFRSIGDDGQTYPTSPDRVREALIARLIDGFPDLLADFPIPRHGCRVFDVVERDSICS